jgi:uncharacterized protein
MVSLPQPLPVFPASPVPAETRIRDLTALAFAMLFPSFMGWLYFMVLPNRGLQDNPVLPWAFGLGKFAQFIFPLVFVAIVDRNALRPSRPTWHGMKTGAAFGVATALAILALYYFALQGSEVFVTTGHKANEWLAQQKLNTTGGFLGMAAFVCFLHCPLEEYYWRWFVFGRLRRHMPWGWAAVVSGLAFMGHHVILLAYYFPDNFWLVAVPFSLGVAVGGMVWAWIYQLSGSIYAPCVSHSLIDLAIMVVGYNLLKPHF